MLDFFLYASCAIGGLILSPHRMPAGRSPGVWFAVLLLVGVLGYVSGLVWAGLAYFVGFFFGTFAYNMAFFSGRNSS